MREFADSCENEDLHDGEVFVGFIRCTDAVRPSDVDEHLYAGKGADDPRVKALLAAFTDALVLNLPPGMPPERYGLVAFFLGKPIEHTTDLDPNSTPERYGLVAFFLGKPTEHTTDLDPNSKLYAAQPRRLTPEENAEIQRVLTQLPENVLVAPSLSPHVAPVVFARKKPDPVTGVSALKMCISYVKLNLNTLNKIACRVPQIAK
jgi:hypothetical protein